ARSPGSSGRSAAGGKSSAWRRLLGLNGIVVGLPRAAVPQRLVHGEPYLEFEPVRASILRSGQAHVHDLFNGGLNPLAVGPISVFVHRKAKGPLSRAALRLGVHRLE